MTQSDFLPRTTSTWHIPLSLHSRTGEIRYHRRKGIRPVATGVSFHLRHRASATSVATDQPPRTNFTHSWLSSSEVLLRRLGGSDGIAERESVFIDVQSAPRGV